MEEEAAVAAAEAEKGPDVCGGIIPEAIMFGRGGGGIMNGGIIMLVPGTPMPPEGIMAEVPAVGGCCAAAPQPPGGNIIPNGNCGAMGCC